MLNRHYSLGLEMLLKMKGTNMKRLMMAATMVGALVCAAANQTYTWPDVGSELTVTYDTEGTDPTKVKTLVSNVAQGDTVTVTGATAILPGINISIR